MIRKNPIGVSPSFDLTFDGVPANYRALNSIKMGLSENQHDMLKIEMAGIPARAITDYRSRAVRMDMDTGAGYTETFVGYVESVLPHSITARGLVDNSPFHDVTIVVLGASYAMRGAKSQVWEGYKLSEVATNMAKNYSLSLDVPIDDLLYNKLIQSEESDWQFLNRYAQLMGLSINCHGTNIHIYDPYKAAFRGTSFNKLITLKKGFRAGRPHPGSVLEFTGTFKNDHADGIYKDTVVTVMQDNGDQFDVSSGELLSRTNPARFSNRLNEKVETYSEAVRLIEATGKHHYDYEAKVKAVGVLGVKPGGVVELDSYGAEFDGMWYVRDVEHHLTTGNFVTELTIVRNINSELIQPKNVQSIAKIPESYYDQLSGTWKSRRKQYRVY